MELPKSQMKFQDFGVLLFLGEPDKELGSRGARRDPQGLGGVLSALTPPIPDPAEGAGAEALIPHPIATPGAGERRALVLSPNFCQRTPVSPSPYLGLTWGLRLPLAWGARPSRLALPLQQPLPSEEEEKEDEEPEPGAPAGCHSAGLR